MIVVVVLVVGGVFSLWVCIFCVEIDFEWSIGFVLIWRKT